jgi:hypothetical protein
LFSWFEYRTCTGDPTLRPNALLFRGTPISHLPTDGIFAFATHFKARPLGLEWVDDTTCVLLFESSSEAGEAYQLLQKTPDSALDGDDFVLARNIPMALWPPEDRINASLGKGEGLRGTIRMRWARTDDVKKRGARKESEFYKKRGIDTGNEPGHAQTDLDDHVGGDDGRKRRRKDDGTFVPTRAELDDELDAFLREESPDEPPKSSKMRSDHIDDRSGKSLLERTSYMRAHPAKLSDRIAIESQRRSRSGQDDRHTPETHSRSRSGRADRERGRQRESRQVKSQQELDDELDAFLNERT